jgi:phenylacetate-CoA ligase
VTGANGGELLRLLRGRLPSADELSAIRERRLPALVRHAATEVPYYRRLFAAAGLRPEDVRTLDDLRQVPVSARNDLRAAGADLFARGVDRRTGIRAFTSGSSGEPWEIFRTRGENRLRRALDFRSMRHAGVRTRDVVAVLGPARMARERPLAGLGLYRTHQLSPLTPVDEQIAWLRALQPSVLWIYPALLRALVERTGSLAAITRPRLLITSAETLDERLRRRLLADGPLAIRNFYGAVEAGRIAWECAEGEGLHVNADCLILDFVDAEAVPGAGRPVVITNLLARAMPIVRYRIGDRCEPVGRPCACGVALPLLRPPLGRDWDLVALPSGRLVPAFGISALLNRLPGLWQFRVVQERRDRLRILLRCRERPAADALARLRDALLEHFGEPLALELQLVDALPEIAGKERVFVSELSSRG